MDPLICSIHSNIMLLAWNESMFLVGLSHWRSCYLECASAWGFAILHLDITAAMMMMMWVQIENRPSHSHAPIEASKRNPSRRLMQTVSSKPLATPSGLWNSSEGCSCTSCVLCTFQQYQFIFQSYFFFFNYYIIGYFCNLCLSTTGGRCFLLFVVHFCPLVVRYYWLWKRPASPNASIQIHLII